MSSKMKTYLTQVCFALLGILPALLLGAFLELPRMASSILVVVCVSASIGLYYAIVKKDKDRKSI